MRTGLLLSWLAELELGRKVMEARGRAEESRAGQYRRYARACVEMAEEAAEQSVQAALIHMAQVWLRLADEHARRIRNEPKNVD